jgi:IS30 family transposase
MMLDDGQVRNVMAALQMAKALGCAPNAVGREMQRGMDEEGCGAVFAELKAIASRELDDVYRAKGVVDILRPVDTTPRVE